MQNTNQRPTGVTILAILNFVAGAIGLFASLSMLGLLGLGGQAVDTQVATTITANALFTLVISIGQLVVGFGLWRLMGWAWFATVVITLMNFGNAFWRMIGGFQSGNAADITGGLVAAVIGFIILYYLYRNDVRGAFR